jgi:hypothetical protein
VAWISEAKLPTVHQHDLADLRVDNGHVSASVSGRSPAAFILVGQSEFAGRLASKKLWQIEAREANPKR